MNSKMNYLYLTFTLMMASAFFTNCSTEPSDNKQKSFESYSNGEYLFTLEFTDFLSNELAFVETNKGFVSNSTIRNKNSLRMNERLHKEAFKELGQCHYILKTRRKINLNSPIAMEKAYRNARPLGDDQNFLPLTEKLEILRTDVKLREIFSEKIHWIVATIGSGFIAGGGVVAVDTVLHEANTAIVKRGTAFARHPKVKASKNYDIIEAVIDAAKAEQVVDELVMTAAQFGGKANPLQRLAHSNFAKGMAKRVPKICKGSMAFGCIAGYTALLAGLGLAGTKGGFMVTEQIAKPIYKERDLKTLESMYSDLDTSRKVILAQPEHLYRLNSKVIQSSRDLATRPCPSPDAIADFYGKLSEEP